MPQHPEHSPIDPSTGVAIPAGLHIFDVLALGHPIDVPDEELLRNPAFRLNETSYSFIDTNNTYAQPTFYTSNGIVEISHQIIGDQYWGSIQGTSVLPGYYTLGSGRWQLKPGTYKHTIVGSVVNHGSYVKILSTLKYRSQP